jgi:hypothetical protein
LEFDDVNDETLSGSTPLLRISNASTIDDDDATEPRAIEASG